MQIGNVCASVSNVTSEIIYGQEEKKHFFQA